MSVRCLEAGGRKKHGDDGWLTTYEDLGEGTFILCTCLTYKYIFCAVAEDFDTELQCISIAFKFVSSRKSTAPTPSWAMRPSAVSTISTGHWASTQQSSLERRMSTLTSYLPAAGARLESFSHKFTIKTSLLPAQWRLLVNVPDCKVYLCWDPWDKVQ